MKTNKKSLIVLASFVLALAILACGTISPTATPRPTPTLVPSRTPEPTNTPKPTITPEPPVSAAGSWKDPDTNPPYTITTIEGQEGQYTVVSVTNSGRGDRNELTYSKYVDGVLTWEYCPAGMHCITSRFISVTKTSLKATWAWSDGGNSGTTVYQRLP